MTTPDAETTQLIMLAKRLMADMRYQIFVPEVTTYGNCRECLQHARGNAVCYTCLSKSLGYIVGNKFARDYLNACLAQRECELRVLQAVEYGS